MQRVLNAAPAHGINAHVTVHEAIIPEKMIRCCNESKRISPNTWFEPLMRFNSSLVYLLLIDGMHCHEYPFDVAWSFGFANHQLQLGILVEWVAVSSKFVCFQQKLEKLLRAQDALAQRHSCIHERVRDLKRWWQGSPVVGMGFVC